MAERMAASGTMGGGLDTYVAGAYQNMGDNVATYDANNVLTQHKEKLYQLKTALMTVAGLLTSDHDAQVRTAIAQLQNDIGKGQLTNQMEIAKMRNELGQGQLGYQYSSLSQQDQQYYDNLSYLLAQLEANQNSATVKTLT